MPDPWAEAAKNYKPTGQGASTPASSTDYKIWQQPDTAEQGNPGFFGPLQDAYDDAVKPTTGPLQPLEDFGRGVMELAEPVMHPVKTFETVMPHDRGEALQDLVSPGSRQLAGMVKGAMDDVRQEGASRAIPHLAGNVAGGIIAGEMPGMVGDIAAKIPSTARAGSAFESLNTDLAEHPVPLNATLKPLQRITEIGTRSSTLPAPVKSFLERAQMTEPMTFPEARDYQGGLSDLSSTDKAGMPSRVKGALSQLNKALYEDIKASADAAGRGDDYEAAMREYRQASRLRDIVKNTGKAAVGAGAGYAGAQGIKRFLEASSK